MIDVMDAEEKRVVGLPALAERLDARFTEAIELLKEARGRVIVSGVGKSGLVARKIAATARALGVARFDLKYSAGTLAHEPMMRSIELYGREVIPRVHELLAAGEPEPTAAVSRAATSSATSPVRAG